MAKRRTSVPGEDLGSEIESRERSTLWPDTLRNTALVDRLLWRRTPGATGVQRAGIAILSLPLASAALMLLLAGLPGPGSLRWRIPVLALASVLGAAAGRLLWEALRD